MSLSYSFNVEKILTDNQVLKNQTIEIENGLIKSIKSYEIQNQRAENKIILEGTLVPGFIDIQVNGGGGCLFNHSPDLKSIQIIARAHQQFGTTGWLPTLITDSLSKMKFAANAVAVARKDKSLGVLGIHFEGPHLASVKKGVHSEKFIRELTDSELEIYMRKDIGKIIVTLAPEIVSTKMIRKLVDSGVIVCLGHSNASFEQTQQAIDAGATGFTHLFNAMSQFSSREPGMVGAALLNESAYYGIILDGIHVHPESVKLALKTNSNMMLVTDAMPTVGSLKKDFDFFGQTISLENNRLRDNEGRLAGSNLNMAMAFKNCQSKLNFGLKKSIEFASINPAKFINLEKEYGGLAVGKKANMVLLNKNKEPICFWIEGIKYQ